MFNMLKRIALSLSLVVAGVVAQETPAESVKPTAQPVKKADEKPAVAKPAESKPDAVVATAGKKAEERRVLRPEEVPGELMRLKSKADIKAELKIRTTAGRPVVFSGVIRNGKLIERIVDRRFVPQNTVAHPRAGVRIWWGGNSDGYIFFRYSNIVTLSITGKLTAKERAEIMRRLQAKRDGVDPDTARKAAAAAEAKKFEEIEKMSVKERGDYLMAHYPAGAGWNGKRYRELRRKKVLEDAKLSTNEELFVKYYRLLEDARFHSLRSAGSKKEEFEPGTTDPKEGQQPSAEEEK